MKRLVDDLISGELSIAAMFNEVSGRCLELKLIKKSTTKTDLNTMQELIHLWNIINDTNAVDFTADPDKTDDESNDDDP